MPARVLFLAMITAALAACSKAESEAPPRSAPPFVRGAYPPPDATAVVDPLAHFAPLAGTMNGREFVPRGAIAIPSGDAGKKKVVIADYPLTCDPTFRAKDDGARQVLFEVPWKAGASVDLRAEPATIATLVLGDWREVKSSGGHVDVQTASAVVGETGRLYARVDWGIDGRDRIEGIIEVRVCP